RVRVAVAGVPAVSVTVSRRVCEPLANPVVFQVYAAAPLTVVVKTWVPSMVSRYVYAGLPPLAAIPTETRAPRTVARAAGLVNEAASGVAPFCTITELAVVPVLPVAS